MTGEEPKRKQPLLECSDEVPLRRQQRAPTEKPPFTLTDIKKAIPSYCFNRSALRSSAYAAKDLLVISILLYLAITVLPAIPSPFHLAAWTLYWAAQGSMFGAVWVLAHECGHNAFSSFPLLDDAIGLLLHSSLLVPYFSIKYSHRLHHPHIGSIDADEVHVPSLRSSLPWYSPYLNNPLGRLLTIAATLLLGWPVYLSYILSGRNFYHSNVPLHNNRKQVGVYLSDACVLAVFFLLYRLAKAFSFGWALRVYFVPLMVLNVWLILITYLHHTHPSLPRYGSPEWDWLRGALATVDRDYGFMNKALHNITDTHVIHHLFSTIPHYHAVEATKAPRRVLGEYYSFDNTPVVKATWREARDCVYVETDGGKDEHNGVFWYKNWI